jgi:hypothetical protein
MDQTRSFIDFLRDQRNGATEEELSKSLQQVIAAVEAQGKKATLTFTIEVAPVTNVTSGQVIVTDDIKVKLPKPKRSASVFYTTPENNLTRNDPRQTSLELRPIASAPPVMQAIQGEVSNG